METVFIDCYGHHYRAARWMQKERPCDVATDSSGNIYQRFDNKATCSIIRISESDGIISTYWTFGAWADRESLTYDKTPKEFAAVEVSG